MVNKNKLQERLKCMSKEELQQLIIAYDSYIKDVVDDLPLQYIDRIPVDVAEFYDNDFIFY